MSSNQSETAFLRCQRTLVKYIILIYIVLQSENPILLSVGKQFAQKQLALGCKEFQDLLENPDALVDGDLNDDVDDDVDDEYESSSTSESDETDDETQMNVQRLKHCCDKYYKMIS